jgi:hypothetical protein
MDIGGGSVGDEDVKLQGKEFARRVHQVPGGGQEVATLD